MLRHLSKNEDERLAAIDDELLELLERWEALELRQGGAG